MNLPDDNTLVKAFLCNDEGTKVLLEKYAQVEIVTTYEFILQDDTIDLVEVSAPTAQHKSINGAAIQAEKQVQVL